MTIFNGLYPMFYDRLPPTLSSMNYLYMLRPNRWIKLSMQSYINRDILFQSIQCNTLQIKTWRSFSTINKENSGRSVNHNFNNYDKNSNKEEKLASKKRIALLLACLSVVFTVYIGGETRRNKAGLSMTSWNFLHEKMPSSESEWDIQFSEYKKIPEYKLSDKDMTLEEYKHIFELEYWHRAAGRLAGLIVILASSTLCIRSSRGDKVRALLYSSLVILQGLLGWYMVQSGFDESTFSSPEHASVSQYRLAAHFTTAIMLLVLMFHRAISSSLVDTSHVVIKSEKLFKVAVRFPHFVLLASILTVITGALTSGVHARYVHGTWPTMSGKFIPEDMWLLQPTWKNLFENQTTVQFIHRNLAYATAILTISMVGLITTAIANPTVSLKVSLVGSVTLIIYQIYLGIKTLKSDENHFAARHQLNSLNTMMFLTCVAVEMTRIRKGRV